MTLRNVFANIAGRIWGFLALYAFVPFYLQFLGVEGYAVVGFYTTLVAVIAFADMGFTATLNREVARLQALRDDKKETNDLLRSYELIYFFISTLIVGLIWLTAPLIARDWLTASHLSNEAIVTSLRFFGLAIALQLPAGLYIGGLMGLQLQVRANIIQAAWGIFRGGGGVLVLWLITPSIEAFAVWQVISNFLYFLVVRKYMWKSIRHPEEKRKPRFNLNVVRKTWRYSAGMMGLAMLTMLMTQSGTVAVSMMLPLEKLGYYSLATTLAMLPILTASPVVLAIFPQFTELVALGDREKLRKLYFSTLGFVSVMSVCLPIFIAIFARDVLLFWTGLDQIEDEVINLTRLLIGGQILQAATIVPYYILLANGNVSLNLKLGCASVFLLLPMLFYFIREFGLQGSGIAWLAMNILIIGPYMYYLHRQYMKSGFVAWAKFSLIIPITVSLFFGFLSAGYISISDNSGLQILVPLLALLSSMAVTIALNKSVRDICVMYGNRLWRIYGQRT